MSSTTNINPNYFNKTKISWPASFAVILLIVAVIVSNFSNYFIKPQKAYALSSWTQTTQADFDSGTKNDVTTTDNAGGEVKLIGGETFSYKRSIAIDNSAGSELADYQVKINFTNSNFDFNSVQDDGADIRFLDTDDNTTLSYWIESWDKASCMATVWVKVPTIDASSTKTIYMHYGNADAISASSGVNTFLLWDDFSTNSGKWGNATISNGYMSLGSGANTINAQADLSSLTDQGEIYVQLKYAFGTANGSSQAGAISLLKSSGTTIHSVRPHVGDGNFYTDGDGGSPKISGSWSIANAPSQVYYDLSIGWAGSNWTISKNTTTAAGTIAPGADQIKSLSVAIDNSSMGPAYVDDVIVRKYTATEPMASVGGVELNPTAYDSQENWYNSNWNYRTAITIDNTSGGDLTDYQVFLNVDTKNLVDTGKMQADGDDIRFTDSDGVSLINYQIDNGINTAMTSLRANVPAIPTGTVKTIYIYYGNSNASSGSNSLAVHGIDGYTKLMLHMEGNGQSFVDSALNKTVNTTGDVTQSIDQYKFGSKSAYFDGSGDNLYLNNDSDLQFGTDDFTIDWWVKPNSLGTNQAQFGDGAVTGDNGSFHFEITETGMRVEIRHDGTIGALYSNAQPEAGTWSHLAMVKYSGTVTIYLNGVSVGSSYLPYSFGYANNFLIGRDYYDRPLHGYIDEFRISKGIARWTNNFIPPTNEYIAGDSGNLISSVSEATNYKTIYSSPGTLVSDTYDTGGFSNFDTIAWNADVPTNTELKFQIRTADTEAGLLSAMWYGPTGTSDYYTTSDADINTTHNGNRWVQYKAYLSNTDLGVTPTLNSITISYGIGDKTVSSGTSWVEGTYTVHDLTVDSGATLTIAGGSTINITGTLTITGNSTIVIAGKNTVDKVDDEWAGVGSTINAENITIDSGSKISADGQGYIGGTYYNDHGHGPSDPYGGGWCYGPAGAGYGGRGSSGHWGNYGITYGSATEPTDLGSGAGGSCWGAGSGGGAIKLVVSDTLLVSGSISSNGGTDGNKGGSGGSVYIIANSIGGEGAITANGGQYSGGGRVAVYYNNNLGYTGLMTASEGSGDSDAEDGTVKFGARPTTTIVSPLDGSIGISLNPTLEINIDDSEDRNDIIAKLQYKSFASEPDCSTVDWSGATESISNSNPGWSGTGTYNTSSGAVGVTYDLQSSLSGHTYYCWRTAAKSSTGDYTDYGDWATGKFYTNTTPVINNVSVTQNSDGTVSASYNYNDADSDALTIAAMYRNSATGWAINEGTTLSSADATITINDASRLPTSGTILIDNEEISYTGKTNNNLTGCTRGAHSTVATTHTDQSAVYLKLNSITGVTSKSGTPDFQAGTFTWDAKTDYNEYYDSAGILRITANDTFGSGYGGANDSLRLDTKNPASVSLAINSGDTYTNSASNSLTISATDDSAVQMRFSNNNSTWSSWEDYDTAKTWDITNATYGGNSDNGEKTVYVQFLDAYNNSSATSDTIIYDSINPVSPTSVNEQNISILSSSLYRNIIHWNAGSDTNFRRYQIMRSTNGADYSQVGSDVTDVNSTYYVDPNLDPSTNYYYKIKTEDLAGNATYSSASNAIRPTGPIISNISAGTPGSNSALITWTTLSNSNSLVEYKENNCTGDFLKAGNLDEFVSSHSVALSDLNPSTTYYYKVRSRDAGLMELVDNNLGACYTFATTAVISDPPTGSLTINNSATYTKTNLVNLAISATDPDMGDYVSEMKFSNNGNSWSDWESYSGVKTWDITNTIYGGDSDNGAKTVYVKLKDSNDIESFAAISSTITYDTTAPTINEPDNISTNSDHPTINWTAASDSLSGIKGYYIKIGTTSGGSDITSETFIGNVTNYTVNSSLSTGTYYAQIKAEDNAGNASSYSDSTVITVNREAPSSSSIAISDNNGFTNSASVNLVLSSTDATQMSFSNDGNSWSDWQSYSTSKSNWNLISSYGGNANQGEKYVFARFRNSYGNISNTVIDSTIYDTQGPEISSLSESLGANTTSATISWNTDEVSTTEIYYDVVSHSNGNYTDYNYSSTDLSNLNTAHSRELAGLLSNTTYYYVVKNTDQIGNYSVSEEGIFSTSAFPIISNVSSGTPGVTSATITWTTNIATNDSLSYGATSDYGQGAGDPGTLSTTHSVTIYGLSKGATYHYKIRSKDAYGNIAVSTDRTFTTADVAIGPSGSISINNSSQYTNLADVNLTINASTSDENAYVSQMKFSNDGSHWSDYETYVGSKSWDIADSDFGGNSTEGLKTVYAKLKDNFGNENIASINTTITYDISAPAVNNPTSITPTNNTKPTWSWSASSDTISGISGYYVKIGTSPLGSDTLSETFIGNNLSYTPNQNLSDGTYYLSVKAKDNAGNTGAYVSSIGIIINTTSPENGSITINSGSDYTLVNLITLNLIASNVSYMRFSNNGSSWSDWEDYATALNNWDLTSGYGAQSTEGTKYVYAQFKDSVGNLSNISSDYIIYDISAPNNTSISIKDSTTSSEAYTNNSTVILTLNARDGVSGVGQMKFSNDGSHWSDYENYSTSKSWDITNTNFGGNTTNGTKTVYVKYKDNAGNESSAISDSIILDTVSPSMSAPTAVTPTSTPKPTWSWTVPEDLSGIAGYYIKLGTISGGADVISETYIGNATSYTPSFNLSDGTYYFSIKAKDNVGNIGSYNILAPGVVVDTTGPTSAALSINNGASYTTTANVTLNISATNADQMNISNNGSDWNGWETYLTTKLWNLASGDGTKQVYIKFRDAIGNVSETYIASIILDTTPPTISALTESIGIAGATASITWVTDEPATSAMYYGSNSQASYLDYTYSSTSGDYNSSHRIDLSNLTPGTTYYYMVRSIDRAGNTTVTEEGAFTTTIFPVISDVTLGANTVSTQNITWATNVNTNSIIDFGTTAGDYTQSQGNSNESVTSHNITLKGLLRGQTYYYRIQSKDASGNIALSSEGTFTTAENLVVVSNLATSAITNNSATISWQTNLNSDSFIEYGTTTDYGVAKGNVDLSTSHEVVLGGLSASTTYHFRVRSKDSYGNSVVGIDNTFATAASPIPEVSISDALVTSASVKDVVTTDTTIVWATTIAGSSYVDYGLTSDYGRSEGREESTTAHTVTLKGLQSATTYHYRVRSVDLDGNIYVSPDMTFTSPSLINPSISSVAVSDITLTSATITWKTNKTATTQIEYGQDSDNLTIASQQDSSPNTSHSVKLDNLTSGVTYYFRLKSVDNQSGDLLTSNTYSFSTITFPVINSVNISDIEENKATINFTTNTETDSWVEYGLDSNLGRQQGFDELKKDHKVTINELVASTTYYYRVRAKDVYGNLAVSQISNFSTKADTTGPVITDIKSESSSVGTGDNAKIQAIVSWATDEPATSQIEYGTGFGSVDSNGNKVYENKTQEEMVYNQSHIIILTDLKPSTTYHLRVKSQDKSGNISYSQDYTVLTPDKEESLLQIILKSLEETFGWVGNLKNMF